MKVKKHTLTVKVVLPEKIQLDEDTIIDDVEVLINAWADARLGYVDKVKMKKTRLIDLGED